MLEPVKEYIEQHKPFIDKAIYATTEHIFPFLVTLFSASYSWSKGVLLNKMVIYVNNNRRFYLYVLAYLQIHER
jgi:hypothetical protein